MNVERGDHEATELLFDGTISPSEEEEDGFEQWECVGTLIPAVQVTPEEFKLDRTGRAGRSNSEKHLPGFWREQTRTVVCVVHTAQKWRCLESTLLMVTMALCGRLQGSGER